jgi:hypothetical protein
LLEIHEYDTIYTEEYINSSSHPLIHQTSQDWICTLENDIFPKNVRASAS